MYSKPALSVENQIVRLKSRGLSFGDEAYAANVLLNVGYYRMSGYWWPLQREPRDGSHAFAPGATFERAVQLYQFDRKLRQILGHGLERIEVAIRAKLIHHPSLEFDPWWFEDSALFTNTTDFAGNLGTILREVNRSKQDFITHHRGAYRADGRLPPAWKSLEVTSFGTLSKLYKALAKGRSRNLIARELGWPNRGYLEFWLQVFTIVRNLCAHHARVWNTRLRIQYPVKVLSYRKDDWMQLAPADRQRMYLPICGMVYTLRHVTRDQTVERAVGHLLGEYEGIVDCTALGFPPDWREDSFWTPLVEPST